ncbi:uncharacterized protein [Ptychodera flava]|uniref:uncharacterized protein n=1 Tax=Ptychodera flava TaxID=63121 RepID=UPI00396A7C4F
MWLFNKYKPDRRTIEEDMIAEQSTCPQRKIANVVTPDSIPEFIIPQFSRQKDHESCGGHFSDCNSNSSVDYSGTCGKLCLRSSQHQLSRPSSPMICEHRATSPLGSPTCSTPLSLSPRSPHSPSALFQFDCSNVSVDSDSNTESSRTSLSLQPLPLYSPTQCRRRDNHLNTDSSSPAESPLICRARRKLSRADESLYNSSNGSTGPICDSVEQENELVYTPTRERKTSSGFSPLNKLRGLAKHNISNSSCSSYSYKCNTLPKDHSKRKSPKNLRRPRNLYERRRSSLDVSLFSEISEQFSSTDASSVEPSPVVMRRNSSDVVHTGNFNPRALHRRNGSPHPEWFMSRLQKQPSVDLGELKFALEYFWETRQLKVVIIKAERIGSFNSLPHNTNSYVKLYLMPGKQQRKHTRTIKRTKDPIFNEEFYFDGLNASDFRHLKLRMKTFNKSSNLKRDEFLGEVQLLLGTMDFSHEVRMWKDLQPKSDTEDLGMLNVSACYQPRQKRIIVTIVKGKDLPRNGITGAPDPYVKVEYSVSDSTKTTRLNIRKQTRVRKKTSTPVFKEAFTFSVGNCSLQDIENNTSIVMTVYDRDRIRTDEPIGEVRLGSQATEDSELEHWSKILNTPDQPVPQWHNLMELDEEI